MHWCGPRTPQKMTRVLYLIKFSYFWGLFFYFEARKPFFLINCGPRSIFSLECGPTTNLSLRPLHLNIWNDGKFKSWLLNIVRWWETCIRQSNLTKTNTKNMFLRIHFCHVIQYSFPPLYAVVTIQNRRLTKLINEVWKLCLFSQLYFHNVFGFVDIMMSNNEGCLYCFIVYKIIFFVTFCDLG